MKFSAGYNDDPLFKKAVLENREKIAEVYFPWGGFATGRGEGAQSRASEAILSEFSRAGIKMNLLLNGNCYGRKAQSRALFSRIGEAADYLKGSVGLSSVTTASPLVAKFFKANFPEIEVRASVNMEIGTVEGMEYLADVFDSFYLKREYNWDSARIRKMKAWCAERGKKLFILANSGCLNFCSARTFHDNLVAHQYEIAEMDNAYAFRGVCGEFLSRSENRSGFLSRSNFIRPEDVYLFENLCDAMKLATRTIRNPSAVVRAYCGGSFSGNLLELTEPSHAPCWYPKIVANDLIPTSYAKVRMDCSKNCADCGLCARTLSSALVDIGNLGVGQC